MRKTIAFVGVVLAIAVAGCGSSGGGSSASNTGTSSGSSTQPAAQQSARTFVAQVDNPWFPLKPGMTWVYTGEKDGKPSRDVVRATARTKTIKGVRATAVSDRL